MSEVWFALLVATLAMFAVLDGWNIGSGVVSPIVARTEAERRQVIAALGPLWSWHEVWLIAAGATFLLAFPSVMASAFAGFYLALWLILWSLVLRGIAIEFGGHVEDPMWRTAWGFVFAASSLFLALLFGTVLGNVIRGVPIDHTGAFSLALFTDFGVRQYVGLFDWYTLAVAGFATVLLAAHGATYLRVNTNGRLHERASLCARALWTAVVVLFPIVSWMTWLVRPEIYRLARQRPLVWGAAIALSGGAWALASGLRQVPPSMRALAGSSTVIASLLAATASSVFPVMLHSTLAPEHSLGAYDGASAAHGLAIGLIWWPVAFALAIAYFVVMLREHARAPRRDPNLRS